MKKLIEIVHQEEIILERNSSLSKSFKGLYYQDPEFTPTIYLSSEIYGNNREERSILAEEIGHYYTTPIGNFLPNYMTDYRKQLTINAAETRAIRRGGRLLIETDELLDALTHGIEEVWELAEWFCVNEDFMKHRLDSWAASGR